MNQCIEGAGAAIASQLSSKVVPGVWTLRAVGRLVSVRKRFVCCVCTVGGEIQ